MKAEIKTIRRARGAKELASYVLGGKLTLKRSVLAKCFECCGNYADGNVDCRISECPLYPFMPYGKAWKGRERKKIPVARLKPPFQKQKQPSSEAGCQ